MAELAAEAPSMLQLVSCEGDKYEVDESTLKISGFFQKMFEDEDAKRQDEVPLPTIKSAALAKVIEFCKHYDIEKMSEIAMPLKSTDLSKCVQPWFAEFIDVNITFCLEVARFWN